MPHPISQALFLLNENLLCVYLPTYPNRIFPSPRDPEPCPYSFAKALQKTVKTSCFARIL